MKNPVISVVIPAYNEENYLPACLKSVFKQDFDQPYEVIVVDNNSTDQTAAVARRFGCRVVKEKRQGVVFSRQAGAKAALGQIIANTDADTVVPRHWLKTIYNSITTHPRVAACGGNINFPGAPWPIMTLWKIITAVITIVFKLTGIVIHLPGANFSFKKSAWQKIGGYNTQFAFAADELDLLHRLQKNYRLVYLPRLYVTSSSRRLKGRLLESLIEIAIWYHLNYLLYFLTGKVWLKNPPALRHEYLPLYRRRPGFVFIPLFTLFTLLALYLFSINSASPTLAKVKNRLEPLVSKLKDNLTPTTSLLKQP